MSEPGDVVRDAPVLVAGATGAVGSMLVHKLLAAGITVRALGRNREKLAALAAAGAQSVAIDLLDRTAVARACEGIGQVFSSANNVMGSGKSSPMRVDVAAHESLIAGARAAVVDRFVYLSARGMTADSPVDFFRTKHAIDKLVSTSGIPFVLIRPTAFMDIWVEILADGIRKSSTTVLFGDGKALSNYVASDDVAEIAARILMQPEIRNEIIEVGGPSNVSLEQLATLVEAHLGVRPKRRHIPKPVLWAGGWVLKPFNEVAARLMRMGYFTTLDRSFTDSAGVARRFGVSPIAVESFLQRPL